MPTALADRSTGGHEDWQPDSGRFAAAWREFDSRMYARIVHGSGG
jgi:hypothetical protein